MKTRTSILIALAVVVIAGLMVGPFHANAQQTAVKNLKQHVEEAYYRYYRDPINISVSDAGVVVLKGNVPSYWDKMNIFNSIAMVEGVTAITNNLEVKTDNPVPPDAIIKNDILSRLKLYRQVVQEPEKINVAVTRGLVILTGTLSYHKEAVAAEEIAGMSNGVRSVDNQLQVLPPEKAQSDENLTSIVQDVLKDQFAFGAEKVQAKVVQGVATLTGTVSHLWVKHNIEKQLHNILGIKEVVNNLMVKPR